ncbi:MAG: thiol reductant ABC exporter subunit CydC [Streptosporangiales bacterium]|nr:thiol reductant ABC exporter subunit CydC [Streptosporangiales bacterium]
MKSRRWVGVRFGVALVLGVGAAGAGVGLLATSGWLIARAAERPPVLLLMVAVVAVRAFGIGRAVCTYAERLVGHDAAFDVLGRLRSRAYARLAAMAPERLGAYGSGRLVDDVDAVLDLLLRSGLPLAGAVLVSGGAVLAVGALLPAAAVSLGVAAGVVVLAVPALAVHRVGRAAASIPPERARLAAATTRLLHGLPDLVAYGATAGPYGLEAFERHDTRLRAAERRAARTTGLGNALVVAATGLACCAALGSGVAAVRDGRLDGTYLAVLALVPLALLDVLGTLPDAVQQGLRARVSLRRVRAVLAEPPAASAGTAPRPPYDIRVERVTCRWPDADTDVLAGVDLRVPAGHRVAVVGASGSGKSTLATLVTGQLRPEAGRVLVGGVEAGANGADDPRGVVGLCAQDAHVFDSTIAENVRLARPDATDTEVRTALTSARLGDWVASLPAGMDTRVGEHGDRLSGGERQRLALARVLLAGKPVVVLDEPAEHLDEPTADALMHDLLAATTGRTVLLLTHRTGDLAELDGIRHLAGGRLEEITAT